MCYLCETEETNERKEQIANIKQRQVHNTEKSHQQWHTIQQALYACNFSSCFVVSFHDLFGVFVRYKYRLNCDLCFSLSLSLMSLLIDTLNIHCVEFLCLINGERRWRNYSLIHVCLNTKKPPKSFHSIVKQIEYWGFFFFLLCSVNFCPKPPNRMLT